MMMMMILKKTWTRTIKDFFLARRHHVLSKKDASNPRQLDLTRKPVDHRHVLEQDIAN